MYAQFLIEAAESSQGSILSSRDLENGKQTRNSDDTLCGSGHGRPCGHRLLDVWRCVHAHRQTNHGLIPPLRPLIWLRFRRPRAFCSGDAEAAAPTIRLLCLYLKSGAKKVCIVSPRGLLSKTAPPSSSRIRGVLYGTSRNLLGLIRGSVLPLRHSCCRCLAAACKLAVPLLNFRITGRTQGWQLLETCGPIVTKRRVFITAAFIAAK
jgi:hypothetical protein